MKPRNLKQKKETKNENKIGENERWPFYWKLKALRSFMNFIFTKSFTKRTTKFSPIRLGLFVVKS